MGVATTPRETPGTPGAGGALGAGPAEPAEPPAAAPRRASSHSRLKSPLVNIPVGSLANLFPVPQQEPADAATKPR